jgi:dsDNA-binding SOS-regulon protein
MKEENAEKIGQLADELDAMLYSAKLPLPPSIHIEAMTAKLRETRDVLAGIFKDKTGDDPWADNPLAG